MWANGPTGRCSWPTTRRRSRSTCLGDAQAAAELAEDVFRAGEQPKAVGGHLTSVRAFAERWEELTGQGARVAMTLGVYDLPGPATPPWAVSGEARVATASDLELVRQWKLAFHAETDSGHGRPPHIDDSAVPNGEVLLWCDPEPVAMAEAAHADTVPIRWVYTPPEHRGAWVRQRRDGRDQHGAAGRGGDRHALHGPGEPHE